MAYPVPQRIADRSRVDRSIAVRIPAKPSVRFPEDPVRARRRRGIPIKDVRCGRFKARHAGLSVDLTLDTRSTINIAIARSEVLSSSRGRLLERRCSRRGFLEKFPRLCKGIYLGRRKLARNGDLYFSIRTSLCASH